MWASDLQAPPSPTARPRLTAPSPQPSRWGRNRPINVNHYANKKSAAESMLDIALLMANASQLKAVIEQGPSFAFFVPLVVLISISLVLQIGVGVLLIFLGVSLGWGPGGGPWGNPARDPVVLLAYPPGQGAHHLTGPISHAVRMWLPTVALRGPPMSLSFHPSKLRI